MKCIVAVDSKMGYSKHGDIPWHIPDDLKWFAKVTAGHTMIMGGNTFRSLPSKFKLRDRKLFVLTSIGGETIKELFGGQVHFFNSVTSLLGSIGDDKVICCGAYEVFAPYFQELYINILPDDYGCDKVFPIDLVPGSCRLISK
jgi:dihydrofolate reductase